MANNAQTASLSQVDRVSLPARSMFSATPILRLSTPGAPLVFGLRQTVILPATGDANLEVITPVENRLDLISQQLYGQPDAWWAIADVSNLLDPLAGVTRGLTLRTPSTNRLPS